MFPQILPGKEETCRQVREGDAFELGEPETSHLRVPEELGKAISGTSSFLDWTQILLLLLFYVTRWLFWFFRVRLEAQMHFTSLSIICCYFPSAVSNGPALSLLCWASRRLCFLSYWSHLLVLLMGRAPQTPPACAAHTLTHRI